MARSNMLVLALFTFLFSHALAQTWTACNPLNRTDCPNNPALGTNTTFNFTGATIADRKLWNITNGKMSWQDDGARFVIRSQGESPTMQTNFYIFWGVVTVMMRAAAGTGIVSSIVLQSEDLDEIDWELIGGNNTHVQSNYFGKGNTTSYDRAVWHPVETPQNRFVNYTTHWTQEKLEFWIDNELVRTLKFEDANNGQNYPQTPMNVRLGIWSGGDRENNNNGTVEWAGGETDFSKAPFTMVVQSVFAQDFSTGKEYEWTDTTGSYQSIKAIEGTSAAEERILKPHGVTGRWNALSPAARIAIIAVSIGVGVALALFIIICCIKQRRIGRREHRLLQDEYDKEVHERETYRRREFGYDS